MSTINGIFNSARSALAAQQQGLAVTGHNIANVNTPGYSRQRVVLSSGAHGLANAGVATLGVEQARDRFLEQRLYAENHQFGHYEARADSLRSTESLFDTASESGISQLLSRFWNAWEDLSNNPSGAVERIALSGAAEHLTGRFNGLADDLAATRQTLEDRIADTVGAIHRLADQIAAINGEIVTAEAAGGEANGLRDQRSVQLTELSELIDFHAQENANGDVTVRLGTGSELVHHTSVYRLGIQPAALPGGGNRIVWNGPGGSLADVTDDISGGHLKGWLEVRDTDIPDIVARLDDLAGSLITEVNAIHSTGFGLDGTSRPFFTGTSAADIGVHTDILVDAGRIAAAGPSDGLPGGNTGALAIAGLRYQPVMLAGQSTFGEAAAEMLTAVGSRVQAAVDGRDTQADVRRQLESFRESVSGVSLDEEMVQLIQFQRAYEAAAKMIVTADEMLQTLIQMI